MSGLRRNAIANVAGRAATALVWIPITPFVLSRLGAERFGMWSLFFAFSSYLLSLDLGIGATMTRFIAAQRATDGRQALIRTLRWGLWVALVQGLAWGVVIVLGRGWIVTAFHVPAPIRAEALDALVIFAIGVVLLFPAQVLMASLQGFERLDLSNFCWASSVVLHALVLFAGLSIGGGLKSAALAGVVAQVAAGLLAASLLRSRLRDVREGGEGSGPTWRDLMHFSTALWLLGLLGVFQLQAGRIVLGMLGSLTLVADYELGFRVANTVAGIPILMLSAVIPTASRVWESEGRAGVIPLFASASRWVYAHTAIALGALWLLAPDIVRVWLGPGHERIAGLIRLWVVAYAVSLAYAPGTIIARGMGKPWFEVWSYVPAVLVNLGLAIAWVPTHGTPGALAAVGVSFGVGFLVFVSTFHRGCAIPFGPWLRREFVPRVVAGVLAVVLAAAVIAWKPVAGWLPAPGWTHGAAVLLVFVTLFALLFLPLGDTQRVARMVGQMTAVLRVRRPEASGG